MQPISLLTFFCIRGFSVGGGPASCFTTERCWFFFLGFLIICGFFNAIPVSSRQRWLGDQETATAVPIKPLWTAATAAGMWYSTRRMTAVCLTPQCRQLRHRQSTGDPAWVIKWKPWSACHGKATAHPNCLAQVIAGLLTLAIRRTVGWVVKALDSQPQDRGFESRHTLSLWCLESLGKICTWNVLRLTHP